MTRYIQTGELKDVLYICVFVFQQNEMRMRFLESNKVENYVSYIFFKALVSFTNSTF